MCCCFVCFETLLCLCFVFVCFFVLLIRPIVYILDKNVPIDFALLRPPVAWVRIFFVSSSGASASGCLRLRDKSEKQRVIHKYFRRHSDATTFPKQRQTHGLHESSGLRPLQCRKPYVATASGVASGVGLQESISNQTLPMQFISQALVA